MSVFGLLLFLCCGLHMTIAISSTIAKASDLSSNDHEQTGPPTRRRMLRREARQEDADQIKFQSKRTKQERASSTTPSGPFEVLEYFSAATSFLQESMEKVRHKLVGRRTPSAALAKTAPSSSVAETIKSDVVDPDHPEKDTEEEEKDSGSCPKKKKWKKRKSYTVKQVGNVVSCSEQEVHRLRHLLATAKNEQTAAKTIEAGAGAANAATAAQQLQSSLQKRREQLAHMLDVSKETAEGKGDCESARTGMLRSQLQRIDNALAAGGEAKKDDTNGMEALLEEIAKVRGQLEQSDKEKQATLLRLLGSCVELTENLLDNLESEDELENAKLDVGETPDAAEVQRRELLKKSIQSELDMAKHALNTAGEKAKGPKSMKQTSKEIEAAEREAGFSPSEEEKTGQKKLAEEKAANEQFEDLEKDRQASAAADAVKSSGAGGT
ncbi:unnamed protein product [Amoebophrya sp. A120]|nr:unnamed protein product [Amoebophrya sp. A120]|eukprot:GSA120T00005760001.1